MANIKLEIPIWFLNKKDKRMSKKFKKVDEFIAQISLNISKSSRFWVLLFLGYKLVYKRAVYLFATQ